ncbi:MAG: glycosyltransferase, partial [Candidatus Dadabacteria bacterium]
KNGDLKYKASLRLLAWLSHTVPLAIYNSEAGLTFRRSTGHRFRRELVIQNGIDTERFKPDSEARDLLRREWGINDGETLIGAAGRIVPEKGLNHFIKAASAVKKARPRIRFVIAGGGDPEYRRKLDDICAGSGLGGGLVWAGVRKDMDRFYSSLDLFCSPSYGEGFPNVVAEAMACGVPCIATNAGDSATIIDGFGVVVPTDDADELARGLMQALNRLPDFNPAELRNIIVSKYSTGKMTASTEAALFELLGR